MTADRRRKTGSPRTRRPPRALTRLAEQLAGEGVSSGLTTTAAGDWALLVRVPPGTPTPIPEIEQQAGGLPVVYEVVDNMPVARPAFPGRGE